MLLNGLTKLINEYKEVRPQKILRIQSAGSYSSIWFIPTQQNLSLQDPKLLCVAYSAVGKLSWYSEIIPFFTINIACLPWDTYTLYTLSSSRMPQLFTKDIALVQQFFESMCKVGEQSLKNLTLNALEKSPWSINDQSLLYNPFLSLFSQGRAQYMVLIFPKFCFDFFRRSLMFVWPFRKRCLWWLELLLTYRGHCLTWWRPWLLHTSERCGYTGKMDIWCQKN